VSDSRDLDLLIKFHSTDLSGEWRRTAKPNASLTESDRQSLEAFMTSWEPLWKQYWETARTFLPPDEPARWAETRYADALVNDLYATVRRVLDAFVHKKRLYNEDMVWLNLRLLEFMPPGATVRLDDHGLVGVDLVGNLGAYPMGGVWVWGIQSNFALAAADDGLAPRKKRQPEDGTSTRLASYGELTQRASAREYIRWPLENPVRRLLDCLPLTRKGFERKVLPTPSTASRDLSRLLKGQTPMSPRVACNLAKESRESEDEILLEYDLWRAKFTWYPKPYPNLLWVSPHWGRNVPEGRAYGFPETFVLCYRLYAAIRYIWFQAPDIRACKRTSCGRLFIPSPRSHGQEFCTKRCQQAAYVRNKPSDDQDVTSDNESGD